MYVSPICLVVISMATTLVSSRTSASYLTQSSRALLSPSQSSSVPSQCTSTCDPVDDELDAGYPITACCTQSFETSYYNCLLCVNTVLNTTDYTQAQTDLDQLHVSCHHYGYPLKEHTFPGQKRSRNYPPYSSVGTSILTSTSPASVSLSTSVSSPSVSLPASVSSPSSISSPSTSISATTTLPSSASSTSSGTSTSAFSSPSPYGTPFTHSLVGTSTIVSTSPASVLSPTSVPSPVSVSLPASVSSHSTSISATTTLPSSASSTSSRTSTSVTANASFFTPGPVPSGPGPTGLGPSGLDAALGLSPGRSRLWGLVAVAIGLIVLRES